MKKCELQPLIEVIIPKLFSFAYALIPDELQAEQLVIDAYSVFIIKEKEFLEIVPYNVKSKKSKAKVLKFLFQHLTSDIYKLGQKRASQLKVLIENKEDLSCFYQVDFSQRAILFLKDKLNMTLEEIQNILHLNKYQVLEKIYNANNLMMNSYKKDLLLSGAINADR